MCTEAGAKIEFLSRNFRHRQIGDLCFVLFFCTGCLKRNLECTSSRLSFFFNVYLFLRQIETGRELGRGRERGRYRIRSRTQALSRQRRARCGAQTYSRRDHDLSRSWMLNRLSHPGVPSIVSFYLLFAI